MKRTSILILTTACLLTILPLGPAVAGDDHDTICIGVYNSRGVALAYGRSPEGLQRFKQMHVERDEAEAAGDTERVKELEEEGPWLQERMHMQVFGNLPIEDILEGREAMLAEVAHEAGVVAIVPSLAFLAAGVETVDVTELIARKFEVDDETLKMVREIEQQSAVQLPFDFGGH